ncbi:hypothetical protein A11A3_13770 [Alcanivorax hongdengensis A-11-3]|uniref:Uncharacterized protein n=2 Tax=Alcanivorax hongdengensis TaxID=519051 RepID=L0WCH3_9GAMM|nr:hypothetical protein A11A3_13770 [Alcanivorax hongdengensis A-11-3]
MALLLTPLLAWSAEQLPDNAPPDSEAPQPKKKPSAPTLDGKEMDSFYLQSPVELDTSDERKGLNAISKDNRYPDNGANDINRQRQAESVTPPPLPADNDVPKAPPPTSMPIRGM